MSSLIDSEAIHSGSDDEEEEEDLYTDHDMQHFIDDGNYDDDELYVNPLDFKRDEEESQRVAQQLNKRILAYEQQNKAPYPISPITLSQETLERKKQKEIQQYVKAVTTTSSGTSMIKKFKPIANESKWRTEKSKRVQQKRGGSSFVLTRLKQVQSKKQPKTYTKKVTKMMYLKPSVEKKKKKSTTKAPTMMFGGYTGQCVQGSQDPYDVL